MNFITIQFLFSLLACRDFEISSAKILEFFFARVFINMLLGVCADLFQKSSGLSRSLVILSAMCSGSLGSGRKSVPPSLIASGIPSTGVASTGVPQAIASNIVDVTPSAYARSKCSFISFARVNMTLVFIGYKVIIYEIR